MLANDFAELTAMIKNATEAEKKSVLTINNGGNTTVFMKVDGETTPIFSAETRAFVWAYFMLLEIDIDDNLL